MEMVERRYAEMDKGGRPPSKFPKVAKTSVRFTDEEFEMIRRRAEETNQTMAGVIREGIHKVCKPKRT